MIKTRGCVKAVFNEACNIFLLHRFVELNKKTKLIYISTQNNLFRRLKLYKVFIMFCPVPVKGC